MEPDHLGRKLRSAWPTSRTVIIGSRAGDAGVLVMSQGEAAYTNNGVTDPAIAGTAQRSAHVLSDTKQDQKFMCCVYYPPHITQHEPVLMYIK